MFLSAIGEQEDNLQLIPELFDNQKNWNGKIVIQSEQNCDCAQAVIEQYSEVFEFLNTQAKIDPNETLINEIQETLKISDGFLESKSVEEIFDDLDTNDPITGMSKRDIQSVSEGIKSSAKLVWRTIELILGTLGNLCSSLVICMALKSAKGSVMDELMFTKRISAREYRLLKFAETIDSVSGQAVDLLTQEFQDEFTKEEQMRLPELQAIVAKEFCKHISSGLRIDMRKGTEGNKDLNFSKLDIVFIDPSYVELEGGGIGFINGICNHLEEVKESATTLSEYARTRVSIVHNASHYGIIDVIECIIGKLGVSTYPETLLRLQWEEFFSTRSPDAKFLQICHSQGAIHVKNALLNVPESMRQRIFVLAIAPAAIIPPESCYRSWNYASRRDIIPLLSSPKDMQHLILLNPDPKAHLFDHSFNSPTYAIIIQQTIKGYLKIYGKDKC